MNKLFFDKGWSLGLPITPPTPELVEEMLTGTSRKPEEVLGKVGPRDGNLTVEIVATHAVMADCEPEYMPVLIAAVEGLLDQKANWAGLNTSTGSLGLAVIVNGPIAQEIGVASGQGAAGAGHHANASIGYALNLIAEVVGGSHPGTDMSTFAAPHDFVAWVFAENEDALPDGWEPFHVTRGFNATDSVVTVMGVYPGVDHVDHAATSLDQFLNGWKTVRGGGGCFRCAASTSPYLVVFGPELAAFSEEKNLTKAEFTQAFWEASAIRYSEIKACVTTESLERLGIPITDETPIPITVSPDQLQIVVAGGSGKHSHIFTPFGGDSMISTLVQK